MTKQEAQQALKDGKKLTHRYFDNHEWIRQEGFMMIMEDGASIDVEIFWKDRDNIGFEDGWDTIDPQEIQLVLDAAKEYYNKNNSKYYSEFEITTNSFKDGAQWQKEQNNWIYSKQDIFDHLSAHGYSQDDAVWNIIGDLHKK